MPTASQMRQSMITKWLSPPDPSINFNTARNTKHKGTTVWFTQGDVFTDWKKSGSLLWINGKRTLFCPLHDGHPINSLLILIP